MLHLFFHDLYPPSVKIDADLEFVFRVTFGKGSEMGTLPPSGAAAWRWARQLGLDCRMAERLAALQAQQVLGNAAARELDATRQQMAASELARAEVRQRLAAALDACDVEVVWLRQAALCVNGVSDFSGNETDSDVLLQESDLEKLTIALVNAGCMTQLRDAATGQKAVFLGQRGAALVLHRQLRFLRMVPGGVFVDLACLKRCGLLLRDDVTKNKNLWVPSKAVQAAEFTAQALVESRFDPEFAALCALLDAQSLGLGQDEDLAFDAYLMLQTDVEHAEFEAWRELMRALCAGDLGGLSKRGRTLLDHALAAASVPSYRLRLRAQRRAQKWQHDGHLERAAERVGQTVRRIRGK